MLSTTFLGHQGWLFESKKGCFLVDPLLCEEFGNAQALEYRVHPPRLLKAEKFPKVDGVVLTHEHDDHFDIPSLAQLDRTIPIFLSSRSSSAARQILGEMGFQAHPLVPGRKVVFGDLELTPFCGDHVSVDCGDEWDTLPFFVRDTGGCGNFFSMVDITLTEQHVDWARALASRPIVVGWTNNALDWSHMADYLAARVEATQECFVKMGVGRKLISVKWGAPSAMLMCAGGFAFHGERAWLNQRVFCVDNEAVCQALENIYKDEQFHATRPGQTFCMEGYRVKKVLEDVPFLATAPRESWPSRAKNDRTPTHDYEPAIGRRDLETGELDELRRRLDEFAGALVGGTMFKELHSLLENVVEGRAPTFALVLRHGSGDEKLVYAYAPSECAFTEGAAAARDAYLAGMECWASDLLAVLRGDLGPIALTYGRARLWNALAERFRFDLFGELYRMSHPLRRPAEYLRTYQRRWKESAGISPVIFRR
jgi:L-ascorbate metabolism protein UlaG (beta-lactamase superfamily)